MLYHIACCQLCNVWYNTRLRQQVVGPCVLVEALTSMLTPGCESRCHQLPGRCTNTSSKPHSCLCSHPSRAPQALLPLLERVRQVAESDPQLRQELQPLLLRVEQVLRDCHTSMQKWNKPTGASGVSLPAALSGLPWLECITLMPCMHTCSHEQAPASSA